MVSDLQEVIQPKDDDATAVSSLDNYLFISSSENICLIDFKARSVLCTGIISNHEMKVLKLVSIHPIRNTNDFVA